MARLRRKPAVVVAGLLLLSSSLLLAAVPAAAGSHGKADCSGTSYSWTGKANSDSWTASKNWDPEGAPGTCAHDSASIQPNPDHAFPHINVPDSTTLQDLSLATPNGQGWITLNGGSLTVTGAFSWSGYGTVLTPITSTASGTVDISDDYSKLVESPDGTTPVNLSLAGTTTISGTGLALSGGGANIVNTGTVNLQPGALITAQVCCASLAKFVNKGTVAVPRSLLGGGTATISAMAFNDESSGKVTVGTGNVLELQIAPSALAAGVPFDGGGTVLIDNNADVRLSGAVSLGGGTTFELGLDHNNSAGQLAGKGTLRGNGTFSWTGGTLSADLTVARPVKASISGDQRKILDAGFGPHTGALIVGGDTTLAGTGLILNGTARLINTGTFTPRPGSGVSSFGCCADPAEFINKGTLTVDVGAGHTFAVPAPGWPGATVINSGTVDLKSGTFQFGDPGYIQAGGKTALSGGSLVSASPSSATVSLQGGQLTGAGTITATVVNAKAVIDPGTSPDRDGIITIKGNYTQAGAAALAADIKGSAPAGGSYDQLAVDGTASLGGTLAYTLAGKFSPKGTDFFPLITYTAHTGHFAALKPASKKPRYWVSYRPASAVFSYGPWGIDSAGCASTASCKSPTRITPSFYASIEKHLGTPDFWGRYIGDAKTSFRSSACIRSANYTGYAWKDVVPSEVTTAHKYGLPILPVYANFPKGSAAVKTAECGQNYGKAAIEFAGHWAGPPIPAGTAIFVDLEYNVNTTPAFIEGWYNAFQGSPYRAGYYANTTKPTTNFRTAYCEAVRHEPAIAKNSFIWTTSPGLSPTNKAQEPAYKAVPPPSCASQTVAWQYNAGTEIDHVDTDEAVTDLQSLPLWRQ